MLFFFFKILKKQHINRLKVVLNLCKFINKDIWTTWRKTTFNFWAEIKYMSLERFNPLVFGAYEKVMHTFKYVRPFSRPQALKG